jgi:amino acid adenylation domain-containing protein
MISSMQEQFLLTYQLNRENRAYNLASHFEITGPFNRVFLQKALSFLSLRHFEGKDIPLYLHDDPWEQSRVEKVINSAFLLEEEDYYKVHLWEDGSQTHLLFLFHHIIFDLRSKEIFAKEFGELYNALYEEREPNLKSVTSYGDYIDWYGKFVTSENYSKGITYWKKESLENYLLPLPTDKERPATPSSRGHRLFGSLPEELTTKLGSYCREKNSDPFLVLLSAYTLFLNRYSGQQEFNIGIPRTNRPVGFENTLGCFVNILPLCLGLEEGMTFSQLLRHVRIKMLGMHRNQNIPYLDVVKLSQGKRDSKYNPLFQAGFTCEHPMRLELDGVDCTSLDAAPEAAQLDLFFYFWKEGRDFRWAVEYCTDLFTEDRVEGFIHTFQAILGRAIEKDDQLLKTLPLMDSVSEKTIKRWNQTEKSYDYSGGIQRSFLKQVTHHPERSGLIFRGVTLSYGEFFQKASSLAAYLRREGVRKETIVGLSMERSFEMVIGMYAIVLAGGTYLPIEPTLPEDYISYILEDSKAGLILSREAHRGLFPSSLNFIGLDNFDYTEEGTVLPSLEPDDRVYILYTSGSTGRPKGVEITHRGLINRLLWMDQEYKLIDGDVLIQKTPFNFDVSGWEFWWPLMKGVPLVIAEPDGHKDNAYLIHIIEKEKISLIHFVPSMLREFLETCEPGTCPSLRDVICSGEALPAAVVGDFYAKLPHSRLHNLYGPTEASIDVSSWLCSPDCSVVPIGRPIANTKIHILDEALNPLPPGVTGEIYLAGTGLARGYLNKPELTGKRFIPNPFDGGRMYKTGDLGQWNLQGEILYLGRNDSQVQLHGLRIELGEIENIIHNHPMVEAAAVMVHGSFGADQALLAYVVKRGELSSEEIIAFLGKYLPLHMVPKRIIFVETLKLNSNGKLDRKSLPEPEPIHHFPEEPLTLPEGEREIMIASLWRDLLDLDKVGREENFFELGGSSLHIIQMQRELSEKLGRQIPVTDLFLHTTVRALARYIGEGEHGIGEKDKLTQRADKSRKAAQRLKNMRKG